MLSIFHHILHYGKLLMEKYLNFVGPIHFGFNEMLSFAVKLVLPLHSNLHEHSNTYEDFPLRSSDTFSQALVIKTVR